MTSECVCLTPWWRTPGVCVCMCVFDTKTFLHSGSLPIVYGPLCVQRCLGTSCPFLAYANANADCRPTTTPTPSAWPLSIAIVYSVNI